MPMADCRKPEYPVGPIVENIKSLVKTRTLIYGGDDPQDRTDYRIRPWNQMG